MKLSILILGAALMLPATGWTRTESSSEESRSDRVRTKTTTHQAEPDGMFERSMMGIHRTLEPVGNTLRHGSESVERGVRRVVPGSSEMPDREHLEQQRQQEQRNR